MKRLGKEDFERLFEKLDDELKYTGTRVQLYVFGGAAVALGYNDQRVTTDVDAIITTDERSVLMRAIGKVGREEDIGQGWLNDAGTASVPKRPDLGQQTVFAGHNLSVKIAGRRHLTAMKLEAGREIDQTDLKALIRRYGPAEPSAIVAIHREAYGGTHEKKEEQLAEIAADVYEQLKRSLATSHGSGR